MPLLEISDLITAWDADTGQRQPIRRDAVVGLLREAGDERGARIAAALPVNPDGTLDEQAVDHLMITVHTELQRLSQELRIGDRLAHILRPLLAAVREAHPSAQPLRLVDVGCGLGYVLRWFAATGALGDDVELVGVDLDATLVGEADRLARSEKLDCRFVHGNAFSLREPATVYEPLVHRRWYAPEPVPAGS